MTRRRMEGHSRRMRLAVLTDVHLAPPGTADGHWNNPVLLSRSAELLDAATEAIASQDVDHVVVLGDIADAGDAPSHTRALRALTRVGVPVHVVPGNHDVGVRSDTLASAAAGVDGVTALDPRARPLDADVAACGVRLTSDDGGETCSTLGLPAALDPAPPLLLVASHYPVLSQKPRLYARGLRYPGDLLDRRQLQRAVAARGAPTVVLHGHLHTAVDIVHAGLLQLGFAALVEWPHAWALVEVDTTARTVDVTRSTVRDSPPPLVDTALAPASTRWRHDGAAWQRLAQAAVDGP